MEAVVEHPEWNFLATGRPIYGCKVVCVELYAVHIVFFSEMENFRHRHAASTTDIAMRQASSKGETRMPMNSAVQQPLAVGCAGIAQVERLNTSNLIPLCQRE